MSKNTGSANTVDPVLKTERDVLLAVILSSRLQIRESIRQGEQQLQAIEAALTLMERTDA